MASHEGCILGMGVAKHGLAQDHPELAHGSPWPIALAASKFSPDTAGILGNFPLVLVNTCNVPHDIQGHGEGESFSSGAFGAFNQRDSSCEFTIIRPGDKAHFCFAHGACWVFETPEVS